MDTITIVSIGTTIIVPLILAGAKKVIPKLPTWLIPTLAPVLGVLAGFLAQYATAHTNSVLISGLLGLAGVGVREIIDQLKQTTPNATPTA